MKYYMEKYIKKNGDILALNFCFPYNDTIYAYYCTTKLKVRSECDENDIILIEVKDQHPNYPLINIDDPNRIQGGKHISELIRDKLSK